jgi:hypothetical protein
VKRRLVVILLLLVVGTIVNGVGGWACIGLNRHWLTDLAMLQANASLQALPQPRSGAGPSASGGASVAFMSNKPPLAPVDERMRTWCSEIRISGTTQASRASVRGGWPMVSVEAKVFDGPINQLRQQPFTGVLDLFRRALWPGFAINAVFYAAILWLLFAASFALRRWRRIKRGLCPKCGYDLRGSADDSSLCPECGAGVELAQRGVGI